jgi:hypothetical protein
MRTFFTILLDKEPTPETLVHYVDAAEDTDALAQASYAAFERWVNNVSSFCVLALCVAAVAYGGHLLRIW